MAAVKGESAAEKAAEKRLAERREAKDVRIRARGEQFEARQANEPTARTEG